MRFWLLLSVLLFFGADMVAQGYYWQSAQKKQHYKCLTLEGGPGLRMYFGDIQPPSSLFNKVKLAYQLGARYQLRPHWGAALQLGGRGYKGERSYAYPGSLSQMEGKLWEGQFFLQYHWIAWEDFTVRSFTGFDRSSQFNAYLGVGFGASQYSATYSTNYISSSDSLVTNFQAGSASGIGIFVPIQGGLRYRFNPTWSLGLEMTYQMYFTDNLDAFERKNRDGMGVFLLKLGYSLGQKTWIKKR